MTVKIYTTPTCGYCHQAKRFLSDKGVKFTEYDVSRDQVAANEMVRLTGQMGVPVIVVDDQAVIGFNRAKLEQLLVNKGNGKHISFGLSIADAGKVARNSGDIPVFGAFVGKVVPSSLGSKAGLKSGDIITQANLKPVHTADDLEDVLALLSMGSRVVITFLRGQSTLKTEIVI